MSESLKFKNAFLTGGAQGLGKSYVDGLLSAGAKVVFGDINATVGAATEKELVQKYGKDKVRFIEFDVTDEKKFEEAFQAAVDHLGYVDLIVNNAGIAHEGMWQKMIQLNFGALVKGTLLAYEHMRKDKGGKGGRIINVSSVGGLGDVPFGPVYCGTKHAVRSFTSCCAMAPDIKELGVEYGILCPGPAATDLFIKIDEKSVRYFQLIAASPVAQAIAPVERIQSGFMKLVLLEDMNGAILTVTADEIHFEKMERINMGDTWPVAQES